MPEVPSNGDGFPNDVAEALLRQRNAVTDALLMIIMAQREDDGPRGGAWLMSIVTTFATRVILAQVGPRGDCLPLLDLLRDQVAAGLEQAQLQYVREALTAPARGPRRVQ